MSQVSRDEFYGFSGWKSFSVYGLCVCLSMLGEDGLRIDLSDYVVYIIDIILLNVGKMKHCNQICCIVSPTLPDLAGAVD